MRKFRYRLETVLTVRRKREEQELEKYNQLIAKVRAIEQEIRNRESERSALLKEKTAELAISPDMDVWKRTLNYAEHLVSIAKALSVQRDRVELERLAQRDRLLVAVKRRKILESLKEKAQQEYIWEENLREQGELDEWATIHHRPSEEIARQRGEPQR